MKSSRKWLYAVLILLVGLFVPKHANAQAVRFDTTVDTTSSTCVSGKQCPLLVIPGATVSVCGGSVTTLSSCLASPATTYTDYTAGTPCPTTAQLTPARGGSCLATSDAQGGAGFWALPGQYNYFLRIPATAGGGACDGVHNCYGPYPINVGAGVGCNPDATCDANFSSLPAACTAAGSGTLYLTRNWNGLTTQTLGCNIQALANGIIKPASGQTVTLTGSFSGSLTQHFDVSASGVVNLTGAVESLYVQWWGAKGDGSTDSTTAILGAVAAAQAIHGSVTFPCGSGSYQFSSEIAISTRITIRGGGAGEGSGTSKPCTQLQQTSANVAGIHIMSGADYTHLVGFEIISLASTGTADGIDVGDVGVGNGAGEVKIENVEVGGFKGNGINVRNGNSGILDHVTVSGNGLNGVLIDSAAVNTNAWRVYSASAFSNGLTGFNFIAAPGTDARGLDSEGNGQYGVFCGRSGMTIIGGDVEANTANDIATNGSCFGSVIMLNNSASRISQGSAFAYIVNTAHAFGIFSNPANGRLGVQGPLNTQLISPTYGTTVTIDTGTGNYFEIDVTNSSNFSIQPPTDGNFGQNINICIKNASGGAMGTITWSGYVMSPWTNPVNGAYRCIQFQRNVSTNVWYETLRSPQDAIAINAPKADYVYSYPKTGPLVLTGLTTTGSGSVITYETLNVQAIWRTTCHAFTTTVGSAGTVLLSLLPDSPTEPPQRRLSASNTVNLTLDYSEAVVSDFEIVPANTSGRYMGYSYAVSGNVGGVFSVECTVERVQ